MTKEQYKIPFFVVCVLCGLLTAIVVFGLKVERTFSEEQLTKILSKIDKIIIGNVSIKDRGYLSDSIIIIKDPNNGIKCETDEGIVVKDCYFTQETTI